MNWLYLCSLIELVFSIDIHQISIWFCSPTVYALCIRICAIAARPANRVDSSHYSLCKFILLYIWCFAWYHGNDGMLCTGARL